MADKDVENHLIKFVQCSFNKYVEMISDSSNNNDDDGESSSNKNDHKEDQK